ncbi:MAG: hypothetical protein ACM4AI_15045 [Acidobacteriota bacterium]
MPETNAPTSGRSTWSLDARTRSQRLLMALYDLAGAGGVSATSPRGEMLSLLLGVAFSLWRAVSLADTPNRRWPDAFENSQAFLDVMAKTKTIGLGFEYQLQEWASGYYLNNAKLRFEEILRRQTRAGEAMPEDSARMANLSGLDAEPHEIWTLYCHEAERLARRLGCALP